MRLGHRSFLLSVLVCLTAAAPLLAARGDGTLADGASICHRAAAKAAGSTGVPLRVLLAITLTETGRRDGARMVPWPWTLNIEGDGYWLDTRAEALARAERARAEGRVSFDTGCFQVNYRWHGEAFESLAAMLDPDRNALYAAQFLARLFDETGDWSRAAGAYHSRTPRYATRYRRMFDRHYAALSDTAPVPDAAPPAQAGENRFPLLQSGGTPVAMGSLVPVQTGSGALFSRASPLWAD